MGTDWKVVYPNGDVAKTFPDDQKDAAIDLAGKIGGEVAYFERGGAGDPGDNITGIVFSAARSIPRESVKIAIPTRAGFTAYSQMGKLVWVPNDVHQQMVARLNARNEARDAESRRQADNAAFNEWAKAIAGANNARLDAAEHLFKEGAFEVLTDAAGVGLAAKAALLYKSLDRANDVRRAFDRADDAVDGARVLNKSARVGETGIKYWDEVVEGSKQFDLFKSKLVEKGWKIVPDSSLATKADIIHDGTQWVMKYDPNNFSRLDMAHEAYHVGQIQRAISAGLDAKQIMSKTQINLAERGAYLYEKHLSQLKGFDDSYNKWIDDMLFEHRLDHRRMQRDSDYRDWARLYEGR